MNDIKSQKPLSIVEAAEYLGFSKTYLYKLVHLRKIPCYKPAGGRIYFKKDELEQFVFRGRKAADYELMEKTEYISGAELLNYI